MPLGNIVGTIVMVAVAMAVLNRFRPTRRLIGADASP